MNPRPLLHLEGAGVFFLSIVAYHWNHGSWGLFVLFFFVPDVSMVGYFANARMYRSPGLQRRPQLHRPSLLRDISNCDRKPYSIAACASLGGSHWYGSSARIRSEIPDRIQRYAFEPTPTRVLSQVESGPPAPERR